MPRKAIVIGLDCLSPKLTLKFMREGLLPNMKRIMDEGVFAKALPCFPAWTPTNWTTIATGAYPGTHGVFMWGTHRPGEPLEQDVRQWAMSSSICSAEYLWEAAARTGRKTVLFYFVGYPQTTDKAIHVDWLLSPGSYFFEICPAACYTTLKIGGSEVSIQPATDWSNLPPMDLQPLECEVHVDPKVGGTGPTYHVLLMGNNGRYNKIILSMDKNFEKGISIKRGEWTEWLLDEFDLDQGAVLGSIRFKLVELSEDAARIRLFRSQVYPLEGFTVPGDLARTLVEELGPYINEDAGHAYRKGWIDWETLEEELGYQIRWIGKASRHLMESTGASLYFIHWHLLDTLQHHCLGRIDPVGAMYDPTKADEAWEEMRKGFALADKLVGELSRIADEDTVVLVVSDHGNSPNRKRVSLVNLFVDKGWMATSQGPDGQLHLDPARSKVMVKSLHIYINLKGREPMGIVPPEEYESLRTEILDALWNLRDPIDGKPAIAMAVRKEDAGFMGMWGEGIGDVVFVYSPGHGWTGPEVLRMGEKRVVFASGGANHGPQPPWTETEISSNYATLIMKGPGVKNGKIVGDCDPMVALVDIAPTLSHLIDCPMPAQSQGRILHELLEGGLAYKERPPKPDIMLPEFPVGKGPPKFKGDVTDEI